MAINRTRNPLFGISHARVFAALVMVSFVAATPVFGADAIAEWKSIKAPAAPELKKVSVSAKDTALIVMDLQTNSCNAERRPRCLATIAPIADLLKRARAKNMTVIHTITSSGKPEMLIKDIAPKGSEPHVQGGVDKFFKTDLEKMLKAKGVTTVILVGTAAEGAVLGTATGAALRKLKVVVPVDGMSSNAYGEQYTAIYLTTSPGTAKATTLTRAAMIDIK